MIELDTWTLSERPELFKLIENRVLPYEEPDKTWVAVTIECDLNRLDLSRSRYTLFDLLADVGGLQGMFASIFAVMVTIWNYNALDNYMVTKLFKM